MAEAKEHICRMRGGAQSHLMRCSYKDPHDRRDREGYFIVKFQNNPQHIRILANEMLCQKLAEFLHLPVPYAEQVLVGPELIAGTPELRMELPQGSMLCAPGRQFGSRFPGDPRTTAVYDFVPDSFLDRLSNLRAFWGMLVFDQWTCNVDGRQAVFERDPPPGLAYHAWMIDQGFCFNDGMWDFPDAPLRGLYHRRRVYAGITGWDSFEPWLTRIRELDEGVMDEVYRAMPPEWCDGKLEELEQLLLRLSRRRRRLPELLEAVRRLKADPFPNWR